jgi:uncharacterized membrane protein
MHKSSKMAPHKVGGPGRLARVTKQTRMKKERIEESKNIVEVEDVTMPKPESINPTKVEEEKSTKEQMEVDKSARSKISCGIV